MNPPKEYLAEWLENDPLEFWKEFKKNGSQKFRNALIEKYLPLVKYHAERLGAKLHDKLELDDLKQVGIFGLIQAIEGFDPSREIKFATYCTLRIRGAILDDLRSRDWVPRQVRKQAKDFDKAYRELEIKLTRPPSEQEMANHLGKTMDEYYEMSREASVVGVRSLQSLQTKHYDDNFQGENLLPNKKALDPSKLCERKDLIQNMLKDLSNQEKMLVQMYYFDELTMKEIGKVLEISESRISQVHSSLLNRLRNKFGKEFSFK